MLSWSGGDRYVLYKKRICFGGSETFYTSYEETGNLVFYPNVWLQRYYAVQDVLYDNESKYDIKQVVDFGCSTMKFFKYMKELDVEHVFLVDCDADLLKRYCRTLEPILYDYIQRRKTTLTVDILAGSVADLDSRLSNVDAVVCIELIEHLHAEILEQVPATIFGFIKPKIAIFTTPNADFNTLFNLTGFRHWDHKFEWTREKFQKWSHTIITKYKDYDVYFVGIGPGPEGTENYGYCTQMAVFYRKDVPQHTSSVTIEVKEEPYELLQRFVYPCRPVDTRTSEQQFKDEVQYQIFQFSCMKCFNDDDDDLCKIPLSTLLPKLHEWYHDPHLLRERLIELNWKVQLVDNEYVIIYNKYEENHSDDEENDFEYNS